MPKNPYKNFSLDDKWTEEVFNHTIHKRKRMKWELSFIPVILILLAVPFMLQQKPEPQQGIFSFKSGWGTIIDKVIRDNKKENEPIDKFDIVLESPHPASLPWSPEEYKKNALPSSLNPFINIQSSAYIYKKEMYGPGELLEKLKTILTSSQLYEAADFDTCVISEYGPGYKTGDAKIDNPTCKMGELFDQPGFPNDYAFLQADKKITAYLYVDGSLELNLYIGDRDYSGNLNDLSLAELLEHKLFKESNINKLINTDDYEIINMDKDGYTSEYLIPKDRDTLETLVLDPVQLLGHSADNYLSVILRLPTPKESVADIPLISLEEAKEHLLNGEYIFSNSVEAIENGSYPIEDYEIVDVVLSYYNDKFNTYIFPIYTFYLSHEGIESYGSQDSDSVALIPVSVIAVDHNLFNISYHDRHFCQGAKTC